MDRDVNTEVMETISRIHLVWKRRLQRGLAAHGLNLTQITLLHRLSATDRLHPSEVADLFFSDRPTTTTLLASLERRGYLRRRRDTDDRRHVRVTITAAGRALLRKLPPAPARGGDERQDPLAPLRLADRRRLLDALRQVAAGLDRLPEPERTSGTSARVASRTPRPPRH
jgi:DNA-binding MarR family transcriptional regulator